MTSLLIEEASVIESQMQDQMQKMNNLSNLSKEVNQYVLEVLTKKRGAQGTITLSQNLYDFCKENGIPVVGDADTLLTQEKCESILNSLKSFAGVVQDLSQAELLHLQGIAAQRNETLERLSDYLKKSTDTAESLKRP